jgi:hypothetical protein
MQFERYALWVEPGAIAYLTISKRGRIDESARIRHGLADSPIPQLALPPLQRAEGGFHAALIGRSGDGTPWLSMVSVGAEGTSPAHNLVPLPALPTGSAMAFWEDQESAAGSLFFVSEDHQSAVVADLSTGALRHRWNAGGEIVIAEGFQWADRQTVAAVVRRPDEWLVYSFDIRTGTSEPRHRYVLTESGLAGATIVNGAVTQDGQSLALLVRDEADLVLLDGGVATRLVGNWPEEVWLVSVVKGFYIVHHDPNQGFVAVRTDPSPPMPSI